MKKLLLATSVASVLSASAIGDKTIEFVKGLIPTKGVEVEFVKSDKVPNSKYEMVEFNIVADGKIVGTDVFFSDGRFATPTLFDMDAKSDLKAEFSAKKEAEAKAKLVGEIPNYLKKHKDIIIQLGNKKSDVTTVVFSDPDCPWCRKHLETIEKDLEKANVAIVLTPLPMHKNALSKSINILDEVKKAKTDAEKIKILRKYFKDDAQYKEPSQAKKDDYFKNVEEAFKIGVNYTPAIFENVKIK